MILDLHVLNVGIQHAQPDILIDLLSTLILVTLDRGQPSLNLRWDVIRLEFVLEDRREERLITSFVFRLPSVHTDPPTLKAVAFLHGH